MCFVTDSAVYLPEMGFMGISVFKFCWFSFLHQSVQRTMALKAFFIFQCGIKVWQFRAVTIGAGDRSLGMLVIHIFGGSPG